MTTLILLFTVVFVVYIFTLQLDFFISNQIVTNKYYILNRVLELDKPDTYLIDGALELSKKKLTFVNNKAVYY